VCSDVNGVVGVRLAVADDQVGADSVTKAPPTPPVVSWSVTVPPDPPVTELCCMVVSLKVREIVGVVLEVIGTLGK
jgi:hypothetical protein